MEVEATNMESYSIRDDIPAIDKSLRSSPERTGQHLVGKLFDRESKWVEFDLELSSRLEHTPHLTQRDRDVHIGQSHAGDDGIERLIRKRKMLAFGVYKEKLRINSSALIESRFIDVDTNHLDLH